MRSASALTLLLSMVPAAAEADELDELMKALAGLPGLEARFQEEKHITLLAAPLTTEGLLRFHPPAALSRVTTKPNASRVLILKDRLYFDDGKKGQEVDVGNNPVIRSFVNSFVLLLAGDRRGLEETFSMALTPATEAEPWALTLTPKKAPIDKIIKRMTVRGRGVVVSELTVLEATGDRTVTRFTKVDTKRRFSEAEQTQYFRVP